MHPNHKPTITPANTATSTSLTPTRRRRIKPPFKLSLRLPKFLRLPSFIKLPSFLNHPITKTLPFRLTAGALALSVIIPSLLIIAGNVLESRTYTLSDPVKSIIDTSSVDKELIKNESESITYNRSDEDSPKELEKVLSAAANKQDSTGDKPYQATLHKDTKQGITFSDSEGTRSITLIPKFSTSAPKLMEGRVVYPDGSNERHIYSFKKNGIKSDIVLNQLPEDLNQDSNGTKEYQWELKLPSDLEAKLLPNGGIGIYSADQSLFGDIQIGDDQSQQLIDNARKNGEKTNLVFEIPAPYIIDANNTKHYDTSSYSLKDNTLTLKATNLNQLQYPISIDPTITVTTTSDFNQMTGDTGNIDNTTADEIRRGAIGSGAVGGWVTSGNAFATARGSHTSVAYNGYIYVVGGTSGSYLNDVQYATLNSNGSIGSWTTDTGGNFTTARSGHTSVAYNGYLYIIGGRTASYFNDVQYAPLNADGSVGTWTTDTGGNFTTARYGHTSVAYNGYLYVIGGNNGNDLNTIQYAPINADGSIGSWLTNPTSFTTARNGHTSVAYNGYIYVMGGNSSGSAVNNVQYAPINANGTVGSWQNTTALSTARRFHTSTVWGGYIYMLGGDNVGYFSDVQYAPINANGTIGIWTNTTNFSIARANHTTVAYNGYMYVIGGNGGSNINTLQYAPIGQGRASNWSTTTSFTTARRWHTSVSYNGYLYVIGGNNGSYLNDVQYAPINADGTIGTWTATTSFTTARQGHTSVAYNGYLYVIGGSNSTAINTVQYAPINADGTIGTWTATTSFTTARQGHTSVAYNGYLYVIGGLANDGSTEFDTVQYAPINTNGSVGTWIATTSFTTARLGHTSVAHNGYLYVIGGNSGSNLNDVQFASINANGTIGTWTATTSFTTARYVHTSVVYNGYLYVIGGGTFSPTAYFSDVQYAPINADGTIGTWTATTSFTTSRRFHTSVTYNGYLYVIGGSSGSDLNDIQYANIGPSNLQITGGVSTAFSGIGARNRHTSVAYNGYIYIIGGSDGSGSVSTINYCVLNSNGSVGACTTQANALNAARSEHTSVVYNGYLYNIGGYGGPSYNNIEYCPLNSNGSVGTCITVTSPFANSLYNHSSVVNNGYLYVIGGIGSTYQNTIYYCPINTDGSVGTCALQTNAFTTARSSHDSVVYNNYLYIMGGTSGTGSYFNDIQYCKINSNGSVGTCMGIPNTMIETSYEFTAVVYNGYIFMSGGQLNQFAIYRPFNQYCRLNLDGSVEKCINSGSNMQTSRRSHSAVLYNNRIIIWGGFQGSIIASGESQLIATPDYKARYERTLDTNSASSNLLTLTLRGTAPCTYTVSYKTAPGAGTYGTTYTLYNVVPGVAQNITGGNTQRYLFVSATLDDSTCGGISTLTSIDMFYDDPPAPPTLILPINGAVNVNVLPEFRLGTTDEVDPYVRYSIQVCNDAACSSVLRTIDQTLSQTGWISQSQQAGTAFPGGPTISQYAVHQYQPTALTANTTYYWRARAIDPGGTNAWSAYSAIFSFVTSTPTQTNVNIGGGTTIYGGTNFSTGN